MDQLQEMCEMGSGKLYCSPEDAFNYSECNTCQKKFHETDSETEMFVPSCAPFLDLCEENRILHT